MMYGQATRTWVSGVGDDANPCSRTAPCKTFAGAISKTADGGEIDALDPGGFGALTITKSITLDGGGGQVASVLVAGTNGIVVVAPTNAVVIIRNLRLDGLLGAGNSNAGINGINFISGKDLNIENDVIFGFSNNCINIAMGQSAAASVHIINTIVKNCGHNGIGVASSTTPAVGVGIDNTQVMLTGNDGIECGQHCHMVVNRSFVEHSAASGIQNDDATTNDADLTVNHTDVSFNTNGITNGPGTVFTSVFDSSVAYNSTCGLNQAGGGNLFTVQPVGGNFTNRNWGNATGTCGIISTLPEF
jgi:hypothetical protein